jgi:hypothetical protein
MGAGFLLGPVVLLRLAHALFRLGDRFVALVNRKVQEPNDFLSLRRFSADRLAWSAYPTQGRPAGFEGARTARID